MKIAVFSDVHGNLTALNAVLDDIATQQVTHVICAGDVCLIGPRPAECLAQLQKANIPTVYGNTDEWVLSRVSPPPHLADIAHWTAAQLSTTAKTWLAELPFSQRYSPTQNPADDLLVVHANPKDVSRFIFPPMQEQEALYGRVRQPDSELAPLLAGETAAVVAFGHLHIPHTRLWKGVQLVNVSSVSMAGNQDPRAKYAIFTWSETTGWLAEHRHVAYDSAEERDAYTHTRPPNWRTFTAQIEANGVVPQNV